jgi:ADP-dependent NAD(P)H-hydrate dehydratase
MSEVKIDAAYLSANPLPDHDGSGDKHSRGRVLIIAGSVEVPGAALLAGLGALRSGAGVLQIATCKSNASHLGMAMPEAMIIGCRETCSGEIDPSNSVRLVDLAKEADAVLMGPGLIDEAPIAELRAELIGGATKPAFVLDASAFTSLRTSHGVAAAPGRTTIVTPHSGEMAKFLRMDKKEIETDPIAAALSAARMLDAVVAMKGGRTHVVSPEGQELCFEQGPIALGTSGSGDVLAGIIAGLAARGAPPLVATAWAVFLHGEAGRGWVERNGQLGLLAREIPADIPRLMQSVGGLSVQSPEGRDL